MKLISVALIGFVAARPQLGGGVVPGQHTALEGEGGLEDLGAGEEPVLSNSAQKHASALERKEAIIAAKKQKALEKAERFAAATAAHKANAQAKAAAFAASKLQKETAKALKEAAEAIEAAEVKAAKDAKQAVKDANHAAKLQKAQDQKNAVQANAEENEGHVADKKQKSLKSQLKTCNKKLEKYQNFSGKNVADFDAAVAAGATGFVDCLDWLSKWEANSEDSWNFTW